VQFAFSRLHSDYRRIGLLCPPQPALETGFVELTWLAEQLSASFQSWIFSISDDITRRLRHTRNRDRGSLHLVTAHIARNCQSRDKARSIGYFHAEK
jgi:hypothetical protein